MQYQHYTVQLTWTFRRSRLPVYGKIPSSFLLEVSTRDQDLCFLVGFNSTKYQSNFYISFINSMQEGALASIHLLSSVFLCILFGFA